MVDNNDRYIPQERLFTDREGDYGALTPEDYETKWSDYGRAAASGAIGLASGLAGVAEWATEGAVGGDLRKYLDEASENQVAAMTPVARRALQSSFLPDEGEQSVLETGLGRSLGLKVVSAAPSLIASIVPAGLVGNALRGASMGVRAAAAAGTARGTNAVLNAGDVVNNIYGAIDKMPDEELAKKSDVFAGYLSMMDPKDAREKYMRDVAGVAPILAGAVSAIIGGAEVNLAKLMTGATARKGFAAGIKDSAIHEGGQEIAETFASEALSAQALDAAGLSDMNWQKVLAKTIEGGVVGSILGGATGGLTNIGKTKSGITKLDDSPVAPDQAVALGEGQDVSSPPTAPTERQSLDNPTVPEKPETLLDQQDKLVNGEIPAMLFTKGDEELALPEGMERVETPAGVIHYDPYVFDAAQIARAVNSGNLNAILGYVQSKEEVAQKQQQGVPAVAVTERGPDGTERRAAATSLDRAQEQSAAFQRQASPDSTVQTETAEGVLAGRQAAPDDVTDALRRQTEPGGQINPNQWPGEYDEAWHELQAEKREAAAREPTIAEFERIQAQNEAEARRQQELNDYDEAYYEYQAEKRLAREQAAREQAAQSKIPPKVAAVVAAAKAKNDSAPAAAAPNPAPAKAAKAVSTASARAEAGAAPLTSKAAEAVRKAKKPGKKAETKAETAPAPKETNAQGAPAEKEGGALKPKRAKKQAAKPEPKVVVKTEPKPAEPAPAAKPEIAKDLFTAKVNSEPGTAVTTERPKKVSKFLANKTIAKANEETINPSSGKHWTKAELAERERVADAAKAAFDAFPPSPDEMYTGPTQAGLNFAGRQKAEPSPFIQTPAQALALRKRLAAMVAQVEKAGKIPQAIYEGATDYLAFIKQAKDAVEHYAGKNSDEARAKMNEFVADELAARNGDFEPLRKRRLLEGDLASRQYQGDVEQKAGSSADPETMLMQADEAMRREMALREIERQLREHGEINDIAALEKIMGRQSADMATIEKILLGQRSIEEGAMSPFEASLRQHLAEINASIEKQERAKNRSTIEARTVRDVERIDNEAIAARRRLSQSRRDNALFGTNQVSTAPDGSRVISNRSGVAEVTDTKTIAEAFREGRSYYIDQSGPLARAIANMVSRIAGDVEIHFVSDQQYDKLYPDTGGVYIPGKFIVVPERVLMGMDSMHHVLVHEAVHAALYNRVLGDPIAISQIKAIANQVLAANPDIGKQYAFADAHEFLSEALSNQQFQKILAKTEISSGLAAQLGLSGRDWQGKSQWWALVNKFADWLGFGRNDQMVDALNSILSVADRLAEGRPPQYVNKDWVHYFPPTYGARTDLSALSPERQAMQKVSLPGVSALERQDVTNAVSDSQSAFQSWLGRVAVKGATLDQLRQMYRGLFTDAKGDTIERLVSGIQRMAPYAQLKREGAEKLAQRFIDYRQKSPAKAARLAELALDATMSNVRLGPNANNTHLGKGWRGWQGSAQLAALQGRYNSELDVEGRALYQQMSEFYRNQQNEMTQGLIDNILKEVKVEPKDRQAFIKRVMDGTMTNADEALLKDKPTALKALKEARELRAVQGDYFPLMRNGDYVVTTVDKIKDTMGGKEIEPGKVEFRGASREIAMRLAADFARGTPFRVLSVQPSTDTSTTTDFGVVVSVQRRGAFFFESEIEANKWRRENEGNYDEVSQVQERRQTGLASNDLTTAQFNSLMASISRQENVSDEVKTLMKGMMEQAAARLMSGNRIQQRSITRRNVLGASKDFGRNLIQYGQASSGYLAKIKYMPEIREALTSMRKQADDVMGETQPQRIRVLNEISKRIESGVSSPVEAPQWMSDLMQLTFLGKLFSPMYSVINGMQPTMVTYPVLAGRYGAMRSMAALKSAYSALGFSDAVRGGIRNSYLAGKQWNNTGLLDTTDITGSIRKMLSKQADGQQLVTLLDEMLERGAMSSGGFEMAQALADNRGKLPTAIAKMDRISRQLPQAIEDINRAVSGIAAYRLAKASGMSDEKARAYAFDTVMNTQGDYSAVNAPRFFANPYLRPALQFKKYAQMMSYLIVDMAHKSFQGATPQERAEARRALLNIFAVQIAFGGALSLPGIEIAKLMFMVAAVFGVGQGWEDQEERLRKLADESLGKTWGELVSKGIISRAIGIDISQRVSLSDMWTFGEPRKYDKENLQAYFAQTLFGAPGSTFFDAFDGVRDVQNGDWMKGAGKIIPIKFVADTFKAANNYSEGKATEVEVAKNIFGVRSARQAEKSREIGESMRKKENIQEQYKALTRAYLRAKNSGERAVVRAQIVEHNKTAPLRMKIFPNALDNVLKRQDAERVN